MPMLGRLKEVAATSTDAKDFRVYDAVRSLDMARAEVARVTRDVIIAMDDPAEQEKIAKVAEQRIAELKTALDAAGQLVQGTEQGAYANYKGLIVKWTSLMEDARKVAIENGPAKAQALALSTGREARQAAVTALNEVIALNNDQMAAANKAAEESYNSALTFLLSLLGVSAFISFAGGCLDRLFDQHSAQKCNQPLGGGRRR